MTVSRHSGFIKPGAFAQRIEDLRAYKEEHGHVNVKAGEDKRLYNFCHQMRLACIGKSSMHINDYRIASLDALGFDWNSTIEANKKEKKKKRRKEVDNADDNLWI